ncbi:hypothetical protein WJ438_21960 [Streptomyces sp. GD-15H]|uniref:hypothetical protein n=1 Tax=Streptomyces sp. GD-15H TaxID=3129112 RepID=UPI003255DD8D
MTEPLDMAVNVFMNVFMPVVAAGCAWLGWTSLRRPRRSPLIMQGPGWLVRAWGLGYLLLGVGLAAEEVGRMVGEEPVWPSGPIRWIAGPLVVLSMLAGAVWRWRERHAGRVAGERRPV